jgi:membrane-bound lytic murein transglycosylase D
MFKIKSSLIPILLLLPMALIGCSALQVSDQPGRSNTETAGQSKTSPSDTSVNQAAPSGNPTVQAVETDKKNQPPLPEKGEPFTVVQPKSLAEEPSWQITTPESITSEYLEPEPPPPLPESDLKVPPALSDKKRGIIKVAANAGLSPSKFNEGRRETLAEAERDLMEEALVLLNESHKYWVNGNLEDALEMLDESYALLLDTNGDPNIARQKDDLRLMISKRILALYNSTQTNAKGIRSEIPVITNADVEKEIRQFQTVERDFFIASYHRSAMYRPLILRELRKAGLPDELAWLPLVESGFKINALSTARALGLWQFIPSTGYKYGLSRDDWVDERMDIEKSTRAAIEYLKELHTMFGDWLTVLAAYNCGEGRIMRTIASQHINYLDRFWDLYSKLPYETARYVPRFLATLLVIRDPEKYGIDLGNGKMGALLFETAEINRSMRLQDIARKLNIPEETLNILNAELRHRITPDKPYKLKVPAEMSIQLLTVVNDIPQAETPRATQLALRGALTKHKVRKGETVDIIARKYNTSAGAIRAANRLSKKEQVYAGQRITVPIQVPKGVPAKALKTTQKSVEPAKVPAPKAVKSATPAAAGAAAAKKKYTIKKGDTLYRIARENNVSLDKLKKMNGLGAKDGLQPGQVIVVQ